MISPRPRLVLMCRRDSVLFCVWRPGTLHWDIWLWWCLWDMMTVLDLVTEDTMVQADWDVQGRMNMLICKKTQTMFRVASLSLVHGLHWQVKLVWNLGAVQLAISSTWGLEVAMLVTNQGSRQQVRQRPSFLHQTSLIGYLCSYAVPGSDAYCLLPRP